MTLPLTPQQHRLWKFISACTLSPTLEEMRVAMGLKSCGHVKALLDSLENRGFIRREIGRTRSVIAITPSAEIGLDAYEDDELIAELERRTRAALSRPSLYKREAA